jgi:hypothetical protein
MLRPNTPEITTVRRDQSFELQPLRHGHQRGIHQAQKFVFADQLRASGEVGLAEIFHCDFSGGQRLDKLLFNARAETASDEIGGFRDDGGGCQQRLTLSREKLTHPQVPGVVGISQRIQGAGIEQKRHQPPLRRRLLPPWGRKSCQRRSS